MSDPTTANSEWQRYIDETSAAIGLAIAPQDMPAVTAIFANLARVAAPLMAFHLPPEVEPAPVFTAGATERSPR